MIVPFILFILSLVGIGATFWLPWLSDLILLAASCAIASGILLLRATLRRNKRTPPLNKHAPKPGTSGRSIFGRLKKSYVVIDGSNVMHWKDKKPNIEPVRDVVQHLKNQGFTPGVVFDANVGHLLTSKYQHHREMADLVGLPEDRVLVVHKGTQADEYILTVARGLGAPVVTNDRYRDWAEDFPEVHEPGRLVSGGYREGKLWLDLETAAV
jgi:rRNA-processing protein FCF1